MKKALSVITICLAVLSSYAPAKAQSDNIKFGAYGRALQQNNKLDKKDTLNTDNTSTGQVLIDLGIKVNPDKKTEIQSILRLQSNIGAFYGQSNIAQLRQLFMKGILGNFLSYQVGDIYLKMTPYTMFNSASELSVNEASVFKDLRNDYVYYENRNKGNSWWQQGAHTNFAIGVKSKFLEKIKFDGFILRNRTSNIISQPTTFHAGGRVLLVQSTRFNLGANYLNLYDAAATYNSKISIRNPVYTFEGEVIAVNNDRLGLTLNGEFGFSRLNFVNDSLAPQNKVVQTSFFGNTKTHTVTGFNGNFVDVGLTAKIKPANLKVKLSYNYTSARFYSSAAQTKRINYTHTPFLFPIYGNDPFNAVHRNITAFDIVRDPTVYNVNITPLLMAYNPAYGNVMPYGKATPNRTGFTLDLNYKDSLERINIDASGSYMNEITGTEQVNVTRNFLVGSVSADLYINKFINFKKKILLHGGARMENTSRAGDSLSSINLASQIYDGGFELEVLKKLDLLLGIKVVNAKGSENVVIRDKYNEIVGYNTTTFRNMNFQQTMLGYGIKYRFSAATYLTAQYHTFMLTDNSVVARTFNMNQFYIMFNMNF
jgi:hypothetical protein